MLTDFEPDVVASAPVDFEPDPPRPTELLDFEPDSAPGGIGGRLLREGKSLAFSPIAFERGLATKAGDVAQGAARAADIVSSGDLLTGSSTPAPTTLRQRRRAYEQAMTDPNYGLRLAQAETPEAAQAVERQFGPSVKLSQMRFPEEERARLAAEESVARQARLDTDSPLHQWGKDQNEFARKVFKGPPDTDDTFVTMLAEAAGGMLPDIALSAVPVAGPTLAMTSYGLQAGAQQANEAVAAGRPDAADRAFVAAAGLGGLSERLLGVAPTFWRSVKALRAAGKNPKVLAGTWSKWAAANPVKARILTGGAREGIQEGPIEQVGQNLIASDVAGYEPNRPVMQGVPQATAAGAILGGIAGGGGAVIADQANAAAENAAFEQASTAFAQEQALLQTYPIQNGRLNANRAADKSFQTAEITDFDPDTTETLPAEAEEVNQEQIDTERSIGEDAPMKPIKEGSVYRFDDLSDRSKLRARKIAQQEEVPIEDLWSYPFNSDGTFSNQPAAGVQPKDYAKGDKDTPFYWEGDQWNVDSSRVIEGAEVADTSDGPAVYSREKDGRIKIAGVSANGAHTSSYSENSYLPSEYANVPRDAVVKALKGARVHESDRLSDLFPALDQKAADELVGMKNAPAQPENEFGDRKMWDELSPEAKQKAHADALASGNTENFEEFDKYTAPGLDWFDDGTPVPGRAPKNAKKPEVKPTDPPLITKEELERDEDVLVDVSGGSPGYKGKRSPALQSKINEVLSGMRPSGEGLGMGMRAWSASDLQFALDFARSAIGKKSDASLSVPATEPAPTKPAPVGKVKEPWEMTRKMYGQSPGIPGEVESDLMVQDATRQLKKVESKYGNLAYLGTGVKAVRAKNAQTQAEDALSSAIDAAYNQTHRASVERALREGKPVPPEVLKDYPDLFKPAPPVGKVPKDVAAQKQNWGVGGIGGKIYGADYSASGFGTERMVTVRDATGNIIGQRDPFWTSGIPVSEKARKARIAQVAREIVRDYEARSDASLSLAAPATQLTQDQELQARGYNELRRNKMTPEQKAAAVAEPIPTLEEDAKTWWENHDRLKAEKDFTKKFQIQAEIGELQERIKNRNTKSPGNPPERLPASPETFAEDSLSASDNPPLREGLARALEMTENPAEAFLGREAARKRPNLKALTDGKNVFHETSLENAFGVFQGLLRPFKQSWTQFLVSDNPDLALGQAGAGVLFEIDASRVNGNRHPKPGATERTGFEYNIDRSVQGAVKSITFKTQRQLDAFQKRFPKSFDYSNPVKTERGIKVDRKKPESASTSQTKEPTVHEIREPMTVKAIQGVIDRFKQAFPGARPAYVAEDHNGLPDTVHQMAYGQGGFPWLVDAALTRDGDVWVNASNMHSEEQVWEKLLHENAGHFATDRQLGPRLERFMEQVEKSFDKHEVMSWVRGAYKKGTKIRHGREFIAKLAENPQAAPNAWKRLVAMFRQWLRDIGWVKTVSENDIRVLLNRSMENLAKKEAGASDEEISLSLKSSADTTALGPIKAPGIKPNKVVSFVKSNLTAERGLPPVVFDKWMLGRQGFIQEQTNRTAHGIRELYRAMQKHYGIGFFQRAFKGLSEVPTADVRNMNAVLQGKAELDSVPESLRAPLSSLRNHIDALSNTLIQEGLINDKLALTVDKNLGAYLNRSYQVFDDPKWGLEKLTTENQQKVVNGMLEQLRADRDGDADRAVRKALTNNPEYKALNPAEKAEWRQQRKEQELQSLPEPTTEDALTNIEAVVNEYKRVGEQEILFGKSRTIGGKDLSQFLKRKDLSEWWKTMMGEYETPVTNYAKSISKLARYIGDQRFLKDVEQAGQGSFLFAQPKPGYTARIAAEGNPALAPLSNYYTTPEIAKAFREFYDRPADANPVWRGIMAITYAAKAAKTVMSVMTQARNLLGNPLFMLHSGHFDVREAAPAVKAVWADVVGNEGKWLEYYRDAIKHGVANESAQVGELRTVLKDVVGPKSQDVPIDLLAGRSIWNLARRITIDPAERMYRTADELGKMAGWEIEKWYARKIHPEWTEAQVKIEAAKRVRNLYPTYSMISRAVKASGKQPLFGPFTSFPAEMVRTAYHGGKYMLEDLRSSNPYQRLRGAKALVGKTAVYGGLGYGLSAFLRMLFNIGDDEDKDVRRSLPEWTKNSQLLYMGPIQDGKVDYVNLSYINPYAYLTDPVFAALSGDEKGYDERFWEAAREFVQPFTSEQMGAAAVIDVLRNQTERGNRVYNPEEDFVPKAADIAKHLAMPVIPGTIERGVKKIIPALRGLQPVTGQHLSPLREIGSELTGIKMEGQDFKTSVSRQIRDFAKAEKDIESIWRSQLFRGGRLTGEAIQSEFQRMNGIREKAWEKARLDIGAAIRLGVDEESINRQLADSGFAAEDRRQLMAGAYEPYSPSVEFFSRVLERHEIPESAFPDVRTKLKLMQAKRLRDGDEVEAKAIRSGLSKLDEVRRRITKVQKSSLSPEEKREMIASLRAFEKEREKIISEMFFK